MLTSAWMIIYDVSHNLSSYLVASNWNASHRHSAVGIMQKNFNIIKAAG